MSFVTRPSYYLMQITSVVFIISENVKQDKSFNDKMNIFMAYL